MKQGNASGGGLPKENALGARYLKAMLRNVVVATLLGMVFTLAPVQRAYANPIEELGNAVAQFFGIGEEATPAAEVDADKVVDADTKSTWEHWALDSTENIGRIWTDKSVYTADLKLPGGNEPTGHIGDSEFLVMLSALSSTSNTVTTTSKPLDIILVLDVSGSMRNDFGDGEYVPAYEGELDIENTYYMQSGNRYVNVEWHNFGNWARPDYAWAYRQGRDWVRIDPKNSAADATEGSVQLFQHVVSRMDALKVAANSFINETAKKNDAIADENEQHRISVVKFADETTNNNYGDDTFGGGIFGDGDNYTQRLRPLQAYTSSDVSNLTNMVNGINEAGATAADKGMEMVQTEFRENPRPEGQEAQQVVIFFTDGEPNHNNGFDGDVANAAITTAKEFKDSGALVYTIGVFDGANPSDLKGYTNRYMQGMSSNYPDAVGYEAASWGRPDQLGDPTDEEGADYYKAADNAESLNQIFTDILDQISTLPQSPTEVEDGYDPNKSGYVTFTDKLGSYMKVDAFREVVFADQTFSDPKATKDDAAGTTTYAYTGHVTANDIYPNANLADLIVTVTHGKTDAEGDTVEVKIPATMIPLRNFKVTTDADGNTVMEVKESYPLRIFFGVSPKDGLADKIAKPDTAMAEYMRSNTLQGGKLAFYTNDWTSGVPGNTIANFEPASSNSYYYFTENTPIYSDKDCVTRASFPLDPNGTYWYERDFYNMKGGKVEQGVSKYSFGGSSAVAIRGAVANDRDGSLTGEPGAYFLSGSPRLTYIEELSTSKGDGNHTATGTDVINPEWGNTESVELANEINVRLGNNGRYAVEIPGSLALSKTVEVPEGYDINDFANREFEFDITLRGENGNDIVSGTFAAAKKNVQGEVEDIKGGISFDSSGLASYKLKHGETLYVYGLPSGTKYTVNEVDKPEGFTASIVGGKGEIASGSIESGKTAEASYVNTYDPTAVTLADGEFFASKTLNGRALKDDEFEFRLRAEHDEPMPKGSIWTGGSEGTGYHAKGVKVTTANKDKVTFGKIEYAKPGTYTYYIREFIPDDRLPSISYTDARYRVTVTIDDLNLDGALDEPKVEMVQTAGADGQVLDIPTPVESKNANFVNTYSVASIQQAPVGVKVLVNKGLKDVDPFEFKVLPSAGAPVPTGINQADDGSFVVKSSNSGQIEFGLATVDQSDINKTYTYTVSEIIPGDAVNADGVKYSEASDEQKSNGTWRLNGITYDTTVWTAALTVTAGDRNGNGEDELIVNWAYSGQKGSGQATTASRITFTNVYSADSVTLDDNTMIKGSKTLDGRSFKGGETFGFSLTGANEFTRTAMDDGTITGLNTEASVSANGAEFNFGNATFTKAGSYVFNVSETKWNSDAIADKDGLTYDKSVYTVTVKVTDNGLGNLVAQTSYAKGTQTAQLAAFENVYTAEGTYGDLTNGGLEISKTLTGRNMANEEFIFTIKGATSANCVSAEEADKRLSKFDREFKNVARNDGVAWTTKKLAGITFTNEDAGKNFAYVISEAAGDLDGVTYDKSQYTVVIQVADDLHGTLSCNTVISRVANENGDAVVPGEPVNAIAFNNTYTADPVIVDTDDAGALAHLLKELHGRVWADNDSFTFNVVPQNGAPVPQNEEGGDRLQFQVVGQQGTNNVVKFGIGKIEFDTKGTYTYLVSEVIPDDATNAKVDNGNIKYVEATSDQKAQAGWTKNGITYASNTAEVKVIVTDNGKGKLEANVAIANGTFRNKYEAKLNHNDAGGLVVTKTTFGHAMTEGQFQFQIEALKGEGITAEETAKRIGIKEGTTGEFGNVAGDAGQKVKMTSPNPIEFTQADAGKVFKFQVSEQGADGNFGAGGTKDGYTYDGQVYTVELSVADNGDGTLTLTTKVTDKAGKVTKQTSSAADKHAAYLDFVNTYFNKEEAKDVTKPGSDESINGDLVGLGDQITYHIDWVNNAVDDNGVPCKANVTITDTVPKGTKLVMVDQTPSISEGGAYDKEANAITWNLGEQEPGASGTVSFTVEVTKAAFSDSAEIENSAGITIGNNPQINTKPVKNPVPVKDIKNESNGGTEYRVGDTVKYTINYKNTNDAAVDVIIKDPVPKGITFTSADNDGQENAGVITWTIKDIQPGTAGTVSFTGVINEEALEDNSISNQATIKLGPDAPEIKTNEKNREVQERELTISKTVESSVEGVAAPDTAFTFTVKLSDTANNPLTGTYNYVGTGGAQNGTIKNGGTIQLKGGQSVTIQGLPKHAKYEVTEADASAAGFVADKSVITGGLEHNATAAFTNTYTPGAIELPGDGALKVEKILDGRDWLDEESHTFELSAITEGAPMPAEDGNTVKLTKGAETGSFGNISFTKPGEWEYKIVETGKSADKNLTFSQAEYKVVVTVAPSADDPTKLAVTSVMAKVKDDKGAEANETIQSSTAVFTNIYTASEQTKDVANVEDAQTSIDGKLVKVGSKLVYTINWVNDATDNAGAAVAADIVITDVVPTGTEFVSAENGGKHEGGTVTWNLGEQAANASGTVSFTVEVTEDAAGTTVDNTAHIKIGDNKPVQTTTPEVFVPGKSVVDGNGDEPQVGDTLTYTVKWANLEDTPATVTITDTLPKGLTYVEDSASNGGAYNAEAHALTWTLENVAANTEGEVSFQAKINSDAVTGTDPVTNKATVQVGDDPAVETNTTTTEVKAGALEISKTVAVTEGQGTEIDTEKAFNFQVDLKDATGADLDGEYEIKIGDTTHSASHRTAFTLKHGQIAIISGLPAGAQYKVTETAEPGYITAVAGKPVPLSTATGTTVADNTAKVDFINTYSVNPATLTEENGFKASKELVGRDWLDTDTFTVELKAKNNAPMPEGAQNGVLTKTLTKGEPKVLFGAIEYTAAGTYTYEIREIEPTEGKIAGITYSGAKYEVTVKVIDDGKGNLTVSFDGGYLVLNHQDGSAVEGTDAPVVGDVAKFVNTYGSAVPEGAPVTTDNLFAKILTGRDWKESDSFAFTITPNDGAPAPEKREVALTGLTNKADEEVKFGFGTIDFTFDHIKDVTPDADGTRTKDFTYTVKEVVPADDAKISGIAYDDDPVTLTVTLKDDGKGTLSATCIASGAFTNTYESGTVDVDAAGGAQIVKTMTGCAIAEGDFEFTMTPTSPGAVAKFGEAKVVKTAGAELGTGADANTAVETMKIPTGLVFGLEDAGKTFAFDVKETKGGGAGYTNDRTPHKLEFVVEDNAEGTITVTAKLDGKPAATWSDTVATRAASDVVSIPFNNSYDAGTITVGGEDDVALKGTKDLTGRPMVEGEFHFNVTNAKGDGTVVATGTNDANGNINFSGITYTTEQLNKDVAAGLAERDTSGDVDVYTYTYAVTEDTARNDAGVTVIQGSQTITVKVTDDRAGKLSAEVVYPEGQDGMVFKNAYGASATAKTAINGTKVLNVESGDNAPNIEGKYTFTLTGFDGAPMPAKTTVTNDAARNVSFGEIVYNMENVFGDAGVVTEDEGSNEATMVEGDATVDGDTAGTEARAGTQVAAASEGEPMPASAERSKTFTYTVTESGSVPGVTNDPVATKTITVTVTDNGDGTLSAVKTGESATTDFTFTNTYKVTPQESSLTGEGNFIITKTLTGRDMNAGEFEFTLTPEGGEPLTASNDASGNVAFPAITFNQPGTYKYQLVEVEGKLGGVTYDKTVYDVFAFVADNGDGTLSVEWSVTKDGKEIEGKDIAFANEYQAKGTSLVFNAAKMLSGRDLKEGEFTFELLDGEGKVLQTVKNGALTGGYAPVTFDAIAHDEPGEFDYQIREVEGDAEGITYDETVFTYHVVVTDDLDGQLQVSVTEGKTGAPVFRNTYTELAKPEPKPEPKPTLPGTGDGMAVAVAMTAGAGALTIAAGACLNARKKKRG